MLQRSWSRTVLHVALALAFGAATAWLGRRCIDAGALGRIVFGMLAFFAGLLTFGMAHGAVAFSGRAVCAGCGAAIDGLKTRSRTYDAFVPCDACGKMHRVREGKLAPSEGVTADTPIFAARLPETPRFADVCCVCAAPATRTVTVTHEVTETHLAANVVGAAMLVGAGVGFWKTDGVRVFRVEAPHCAAHDDGAALSTLVGEPVLKLRSLRALVAFCKNSGVPANRTVLRT